MSKITIPLFIICLLFIFCTKSDNPVSYNISEEGSWGLISNVGSGFREIYFADSHNGWVVGEGGKIKHTVDGGKTWVSQTSRKEIDLWSVLFIDDKKGFATGSGKSLFCTDDSGLTWNRLVIPSDSSGLYNSLCRDNQDNLWLISDFGEVYCSTDLGKNWICKFKHSIWELSNLSFPETSTGFIWREYNAIMYKTTDGANTWQSLQVPLIWIQSAYFLNKTRGWIAGHPQYEGFTPDSAEVYTTFDGGQTWEKQTVLKGMFLENMVFINELYGWTCIRTTVSDSKIYFTSDGGYTWKCQFVLSEVDENDLFLQDIFFCDGIHGWALTYYGGIYKFINY